MRSTWRAVLGAVIVLSLAVFTVIELWRGASSRSRTVILALRGEEVRRLALRSGYPLQDLWERIRVIGVRAIVLNSENAQSLWERGEVLHFTGARALEWPWADPASATRGNTLWMHDRALLQRLQTSAARKKLAVNSGSSGGLLFLRLPDGLDLRDLPAGIDPEAYRWAKASGLALAFSPDEADPLVASDIGGRAIYLADPTSDDFDPILQIAKHRKVRVAWEDGARLLEPNISGISGAPGMLSESFTAEDIPGQLWRAIWGRGARLLIVPMPSESGIESDLGRLRRIAGQLRKADFALDFTGAMETLPAWGASEKARCLLAFLLAAIAPMLAVRQGLAALRCVSCKTLWPQAYPVPELALGILRTFGVAALSGVACYALLNFPFWKLGPWRVYWDIWSFGIPLELSVLALYLEDLKNWRKLLDRTVTLRDLLRMMAWVLVVVLLAHPPHFPVHGLPEGLWWLPFRWKEVLVGVPCLLMAFRIHLHRLESKQPQPASKKHAETEADPRHWLLFGLLAPIGTLHAFGVALMPPEMLLVQTIEVFAIGSALGVLLIGSTLLLNGPHPGR